MEEKDIYAALGITPKGEEGGADDGQPEEREVAEPDDDAEVEEGGKEQDVAEPADGADDEQDDSEQDDSEPGSEKKDVKPQSKEERAKRAAERRKAEQQAAIEAALKQEREKNDSEWSEFFKKARLSYKKDGETVLVDNRDKYAEYVRQQDFTRVERELKAGRLTPETFASAVKNVVGDASPSAKATPSAAPPAAVPAKSSPALEEFRNKTQSEIDEIAKYEPTVKSMEDLRKLDRYPAMLEKLKSGYNFIDAYVAAYRDRIAENAAAARQQAMNAERSKSHLTGTTQRGAGAVAVPEDVKALYRALIPGISDSDITKKYNRQLKK